MAMDEVKLTIDASFLHDFAEWLDTKLSNTKALIIQYETELKGYQIEQQYNTKDLTKLISITEKQLFYANAQLAVLLEIGNKFNGNDIAGNID